MSNVQIEPSWKAVLNDEFEKSYFQQLRTFLYQEKASGQRIYPPGKMIFSAFDSTPFDKVRVVIIGQDPYHNIGQAHGLCFSVLPGVAIPASLINIYKELEDDPAVQFSVPNHGYLQKWADQGVLMLNAILTVRAHQAASHQGKGWEEFTDSVIKTLNEEKDGLVFLLWGSYAQRKGAMLDTSRHFVLKAPHPSPLSAYRGFFGCRHFSQVNHFLHQRGEAMIDWQV
ncbi:MAG: uracil-DNA glycosylase [Bacteroidia bacterium]